MMTRRLARKNIRTGLIVTAVCMLMFGLTFVVLDREYITRVRRERGYGVNPWTTHTRFLISQRLLVDEAYIHFCDAPSAVDLVASGHDDLIDPFGFQDFNQPA